MRTSLWTAIMGMTLGISAASATETTIPPTFPEFVAPGNETELQSLRRLFWLHYPGSGPKATLWDEWLPNPSLWPAVEGQSDTFRQEWRSTLSERILDSDGYLATHQHSSIAHQLGWPFPFWRQGRDTWGWHFSLKGYSPMWTGTEERTQEGWTLANAQDKGIAGEAWNIELTAPDASVTTPPIPNANAFESPFIQFRWKAKGLGSANPYLEWTTQDAPDFSPQRRMYFTPIESDEFVYAMIPMHQHPAWKGAFNRLRIRFDNSTSGAHVGIQALFTQFDTRHTINASNFIRGCAKYFSWTKDLAFLRQNINRMRTALRYDLTEFRTQKEGVVHAPWIGHEGRSGVVLDAKGQKTILPGEGIGGNYWDLLPFGGKDAYATVQHYDAVRWMAQVERAIAAHPEWNIPVGALAFDSADLERHADRVKRTGNRLFWNRETGRFVAAIDDDGKTHDYGFTFLNLEAVHYGFATEAHAKSILSWINGDRIVKSDTSQGADIYHWRFGPRSTTKRNLDYYAFVWSGPETIPWGDQVQDGGAVLGFSYHDLMARLNVLGPNNAAARLKKITAWFDETVAAGGYRKYYDGSRPGTMQGSGTPGGLGLDMEFFESALVPQVLVDGFLGLRPTPEGFAIKPNLPSDWPELTVTRIRIADGVWRIRAMHDAIELTLESVAGAADFPIVITWPEKTWTLAQPAASEASVLTACAPGSATIPIQQPLTITLARKKD
ncbi:MAG TPA: hypothetical protein PLO62_11140 [Candidatus Hydrogenedentes bacterium]|nr:hypothetical protein [Candidatus Hydrogenedentota bacterium]